MQNIIVTIINAFSEWGDWSRSRWNDFLELIEEVWDASMQVVDMIGIFYTTALSYYWQFWQDIFLILGKFAIDLMLVIPEFAVSLLPDMPDGPDSFSIPAQANVYLPVVEAAALTAAWGTVFGLIGVYKLGKFVRGGG